MGEEDDPTVIGKIRSVAVKDFVTYDVTIFFPDENLNIIIGPNGTGKSTIVAAIVLGMGGHCNLLSRSNSIEDYIKNGKTVAKIEIRIFKNAKRDLITFNRSFDRKKNDFFEVDGKKVSHKEYLKRIKQFNIQIDNLCQFLPQDRVQDFAKMNSKELLKNTQVSVCDEETTKILDQLIEMRAQQKNLSKTNVEDFAKLKEEEAKNEKLRGQIEAMEVRNNFLKDIAIGNAKRAWRQYEELYTEFTNVKDDFKAVKKLVDERQKKLDPLKQKTVHIQKVKTDLGNKIKSEQNKMNEISMALHETEGKTEAFEDGIVKAKREVQDAISQLNDRENEIDEAKKILSALIEDCKRAREDVGSEEAHNAKMQEIKRRMEAFKKETAAFLDRLNQLNQKVENELNPEIVTVERRMKHMENTGELKLKFLQMNHQDTYQATLWLRENRHLFRGKIYEPIILEINITDQANAKYFENTVPIRDLIGFTCERTDDMGLFLKKVREDMQLKQVNCIQSNPATEIEFHADISMADLEPFGFHTFMIDMIEGPLPILNYLCRLYRIHAVPVGSENVQQYTSQVPDEIRLFFTPTSRFAVSKSKYGGGKSSRSDEIQSKNILNKTVDQEGIAEKRRQLQTLKNERDQIRNSRNKIEDQLAVIQTQSNEVNMEKRRMDEKYNYFEQSKKKLLRQEKKFQELSERKIDIDEVKAKSREKIKKILTSIIDVQKKKIVICSQYMKSACRIETLKTKLNIYLSQNADLESELRMAEDGLNSAKQSYTRVENRIETVKSNLKKKQTSAKALTDNKTPSNVDFPYTTQFENLPNDLDELQRYIDEIQARVDCMADAGENIAEEFERRQKAIEDMRAAINNATKSHEKLDTEMARLHAKWYPKIYEIVKIIDGNFSNFMESMGFAGEVALTTTDEREYADYGIAIRVKYRNNERLQTLDRYVQSGGERAVAIAVYTLSLQHISNVPFRCVDEINQGMDPRNERKIFEMLVKETCQPGKSQYFFVTPKLLPNLMYNDLMSVFIVHNGKLIESPHLFVSEQLQEEREKKKQSKSKKR